jgi:hypothetical protein
MNKYFITISGYGAEVTIGNLSDQQLDIIREKNIENKPLSEIIWDEDLEKSWYEFDNLYHNYGVGDVFTISIEDSDRKEIYSFNEDILYSDTGILEYVDKFIDTEEPVVMSISGEKGVFFETNFEIDEFFDLNKFKIFVDEEVGINSFCYGTMISKITYDGEELDNWGGSTNGKYFDVYTNVKSIK